MPSLSSGLTTSLALSDLRPHLATIGLSQRWLMATLRSSSMRYQMRSECLEICL
jgi:hypothetical protein